MKKSLSLLFASLLLTAACAGDEPDFVGAPGVTIEEIAVYQGVKHSLVGGDEGLDIPVVAGRDALVRVFATGNDQYNREGVLARLTLATPDGGEEVFEEAIRTVPLQTDEPALGSTINFWLPGDVIATDTNYRLELLQESATAKGDNPNAAFPVEEGLVTPLGAVRATRPLEIVLVPVRNNGLEPDVGAEQVERYRQGFMDQYPATEVNVSVREPVSFDNELSAGGAGWDTLLNQLASLRSQDGVGPEVYYYGVFTPKRNFNDYCTGGCILGLGYVPGVSDSYMRAAIGLGYTGQGSVDTAVHEVGHNHGRQHAPCGVDYADPSFPHSGAGIGTWGLSMATRELKSPYAFTDFMGYCADTWVSDYTYKALYDRMTAVDAYRTDGQARTYGRVQVGAGGDIKPLSPITIESPLNVNRSFVGLDDNGDSVEGEGRFIPYDHIEGGVLIVPDRFADLQITALGDAKLDL